MSQTESMRGMGSGMGAGLAGSASGSASASAFGSSRLGGRVEQTCDNCGGHFPGEGISREGGRYCTDLCADEATRRRDLLSSPYVLGGAFALGFLLGSGLLSFRTAIGLAMTAERYRVRDLVMGRLF
jgi:hypothetical protein